MSELGKERSAASGSAPGEVEADGRSAPVARPLLFLDVDGVLNCITIPRAKCEPGARQRIPAGTRERIGRLLPLYDFVWATAWQGAAHRTFRDDLALPAEPWPHIGYLGFKLPEILRHAGPRRWAWVDDDADWELKRLGWTRDKVSGLIVTPKDHTGGLTDEHVEALIAYATEADS